MSDCSSKACIDKPEISILSQSKGNKYLTKEISMEIYYPSRPLYRTEIGRMTWRIFHKFSTLYDENQEEDKYQFKNFVKGLKSFFPCPSCREDFKNELNIYPINDLVLSSKNEIIKFVCHHHNQVNIKLNKSKYDCNDIKYILKEYDF